MIHDEGKLPLAVYRTWPHNAGVPSGSECILSNVWRPPGPGEPRATVLSHPEYQYEASWTTDDPADLIAIAADYLAKTREAFNLPPLFDTDVAGVAKKFVVPLCWLQLARLPIDSQEPAPPRASFWLKRFNMDSDPPTVIHRTAVLLAVQSLIPNDDARALGSRLGIRILAHVAASNAPPYDVRVVGVSSSAGLRQALGPLPDAAVKFFQMVFSRPMARTELFDKIRAVGGLRGRTALWLDGFRVRGTSGGNVLLDVYLNMPRLADTPNAPAFAVTARLLVGYDGTPDVQQIEAVPQVAHALDAKVFPQDPASQAGPNNIVDARPSRAPDRLKKYWAVRTLPGLPNTPTSSTPLEDGGVQVMQSRLADKNADETQTMEIVPNDIPHPRTNWFAALSAYQHSRGLFDTMVSYGLSPASYFRFASLPLRVRYRAPIEPGGRDGKTINAQVDYDPPDAPVVGPSPPWNPAALKPLQVRFALADLRRSWSRREPLRLATDERWSWHEDCHVLLAAATGGPELGFAHSAGDALAAIMCDPDSKLLKPEYRGLTFPWVYVGRRHHRSVFDGWSWTGRYHRPRRFPTVNSNARHKGYQSEQILSASLFRLYRALGGDTVVGSGPGLPPDRPFRRRAADYTCYLIMSAIQAIGAAAMVPPEKPHQFVVLLQAADTGLVATTTGPLSHRLGGWAHKVVRWAFEAQGLDEKADESVIIDAPGKPPDVDVFIANGRTDVTGVPPHDGGYMPVSLDWDSSPLPAWHATQNAVKINGNTVTVDVRNRGLVKAQNVKVRAWWIRWPLGQSVPPPWDPKTWTKLPGHPAHDVPAGGHHTFPNFMGVPTGAGRYLILAEATCPLDPSNADPTTPLPCATGPTPIVDLVAGDNNIGLRLLVR